MYNYYSWCTVAWMKVKCKNVAPIKIVLADMIYGNYNYCNCNWTNIALIMINLLPYQQLLQNSSYKHNGNSLIKQKLGVFCLQLTSRNYINSKVYLSQTKYNDHCCDMVSDDLVL